jgi:hypothetical protein
MSTMLISAPLVDGFRECRILSTRHHLGIFELYSVGEPELDRGGASLRANGDCGAYLSLIGNPCQ